MRELSLHILDLVENSVRAGASLIRVEVADEPAEDRVEFVVEDNGSGLAVDEAKATDPFYTTKPGKRTGLGLSLLRFQAEQAGGGLELGRSGMGGLRARAVLKRSHVDRYPLGDLASTLSGVVAGAEGELDLRVELRSRGKCVRVSSAELTRQGRGALSAAQDMQKRIRQGLSDLSIECE